MARGQVSVRLQRIQQVAVSRGVATRPRAVTTTPSGFLSRSRFAQIETQQARQQQALDSIVNQISSLNNINQINAILNSAPSIISPQIAEIRANINNQQNETISKLNSDLASKKRSQEKYRQRRRKAEDKDRKDRYGVKEDEYEAEARELTKLIGQMKSGNLYTYSSVISRVNDVGRFERKREQFKIEKRKAQAEAEVKAQKETLDRIRKEGLTPVVNANTGKLIGYQGGKDTGFAEYRFDTKGNPQFLKSTRFSPVRSAGVITGYIDKVAKMSIPVNLLDRHISNLNKQAEKQTIAFNQFQGALKKVKLPSGYKWDRDKAGTIVNITLPDGVTNPIDGLGHLPQITNAWLLNPVLKKAFTIKPKELFKVTPKPAEAKLSLLGKFSINKWNSFVTGEQYKFYKNAGGKLSKEDFNIRKWNIGKNGFKNTAEGKRITQALNKGLNDQIKNPEKYGTTARITGLLTAGSAVGLPTASLILFGSTYFGTLGLAKDVSRSPLPKDFKSIAKVVGKNFGLGAVQGLLYGLAFKGAGTLGKKLLTVSFLKGGISKATQLAIKRGLSILGVNYVSRLAGRTTFNIKNIAVGDVELGAGELSKDLGTLVGFAIPTVASKLAQNKKIKIQKKIVELEKFRRGSMNSAFLKAKNAQLLDPARGEFKSSGIVKKLNKNAINSLSKIANQKGVTKSQLLDGSYYVQNFKVRSDVPKYEALLKVAKARAKGKTIKIKSVPKFFTFKRYGVVMARQTKAGTVEAFAIEFNWANGKVSNIGFKTAVGANKITAISVYKKIRAVKGKPIRVRFKDLFLVKNKFETKIPSEKGLVRILNTLETKKVFLNNKQLSKSQILNLKSAMKKDFTLSKKPNLEVLLKALYKNKGVTSKSGFSNVIRIQRVANTVKIIPATKKSPVGFKIFPKGQYIEVGFTKFRIPSIKPVKVIQIKVTPAKVIKPFKPKITKEPIAIKPITIKKIEAPVRSMQIQVKKGVTKIKTRQVETAVKSIQTIIRPRLRAGKLTKIIPISVTKTLMKQIGVLLPLVSTKNVQAMKNIQSNIRVAINIQSGKQINQVKQLQIKSLQSVSVSALKNISLVKPVTPTVITPTIPTKRVATITKKPPVTIGIIPTKAVKKVIKKKKEFGFTSSVIKERRKKDLNKIPISKERAFDIVSYNLSRSKLVKGRISKSGKEVTLSTLKRKITSIPTGYFRRNRSRFILRRLKTRIETYEIIRKSIIPTARVTPKKRKSTTRKRKRKSVVPKAKVTPKKRKVKRRSTSSKKKKKK